MANLAALQAELQALDGLTAGLDQDGLTVGVTAQLLHWNVLHRGAAVCAALSAAGAQGGEA